MANKRITDVDFIEKLESNESFFINQNNAIKQINKKNVVFGIANGGTGATTPEEARANLGITLSSGSLLHVNAPSGVTVIAAKGETTYDKVADSNGLAVFENLSVGTWTIKITDGEDIAIQTVTIQPDYSITMEFFAAYISVTYPEGSTCTCTDGNTILTAPNTSGNHIFVVKNIGTWTIQSTDGSQSDTESVSITENKQSASVTLKYFAATISAVYPSGSTCTCTDGITTLTAPDTSGSYIFTVKNTGTWTVSCTDGSQTDSESVSITADGQSNSVTLRYFEATINITYPSGSTCTCTNGATTLTAPDTSGTWACVVPNTGTWTVSCTDGSQTDSESVSITADGQSNSVTLLYWDGTLYESNNQYNDITGGWGSSGWSAGMASFTIKAPLISSNGITLTGTDGQFPTAGTANKIDLSNVSTISVNVAENSFPMYSYIAVNTEKKVMTTGAGYNMTAMQTITGTGIKTLDVRTINEECYVVVFAYGSSSARLRVTEIKLE